MVTLVVTCGVVWLLWWRGVQWLVMLLMMTGSKVHGVRIQSHVQESLVADCSFCAAAVVRSIHGAS